MQTSAKSHLSEPRDRNLGSRSLKLPPSQALNITKHQHPKSLKIEPYSTKISPDSINYINGLLHYKNTFQDTVTIVLKYNYLVKDLPIIVGYNFNDLDKGKINSALAVVPFLN